MDRQSMDATNKATHADAPQRIRDADIQSRYGHGDSDISPRLAGEWRRAAIAAGVLKRFGRFTVGRWSELDAWIANGGEKPARRRGGSR